MGHLRSCLRTLTDVMYPYATTRTLNRSKAMTHAIKVQIEILEHCKQVIIRGSSFVASSRGKMFTQDVLCPSNLVRMYERQGYKVYNNTGR